MMREEIGDGQAVNEGFIALGARGEAVATVQRMLTEAGFQLDPTELARSYFGRSTAQAIRVAQQRLELMTTGVVDARTLEALRVSGDQPPAKEGPQCVLLPGLLIDDIMNAPLSGLVVRAFALKD